MNYLVIDLEMCNVPRDYRSRSYKYANETIQIGAVLLDEEFKRIGTLSQYVHPEHGVIDPFIQNLTGIRNSQVKKAPRIEEALLHMIDWIGDREYKVYAWSGSDRAQLLHEIKAKKICDERILDFVCEARWIDYQDVFVKRFGIERKIGLEEALGRVEIEPEGRLHDELLWDYREDFHDNMLTILKKHCEDEDFNVSLYSNLLLENYSSDDSFKYIRNSKSYFDEIPNRGHKLFIKKNRPSPWINGYDCVMEQIELLSERLEVDGEHLEKRVADYCDKIPDTVQLIKLGRKWWGCRVVCENPNRSFLRVLYKDWYNHKFDWEEAELGRIVLSASEPYCLLITPQLWTYNNGYLLNPPESFISSSSVEQKKQIHDILFEGVDDTETVLAGGIIDYTHKEEIFGFMVSYFSIPGLPSKYAAYCYERNSRLLLQSRPDFSEQEHYNITLHHNGIESFQGSNIMCGFSKISLDEFHWHINITVNGMRLFNEGGQEIGRFEYYYGQRGNMGNRYISNQPLLQRWVVSKDAVSKARCIVGCPNNIKINHAFDSVIRKYED